MYVLNLFKENLYHPPRVDLGLTDPNATLGPYNGETTGDLKVISLHLTWAHKDRKLSERTGVPDI